MNVAELHELALHLSDIIRSVAVVDFGDGSLYAVHFPVGRIRLAETYIIDLRVGIAAELHALLE